MKGFIAAAIGALVIAGMISFGVASTQAAHDSNCRVTGLHFEPNPLTLVWQEPDCDHDEYQVTANGKVIATQHGNELQVHPQGYTTYVVRVIHDSQPARTSSSITYGTPPATATPIPAPPTATPYPVRQLCIYQHGAHDIRLQPCRTGDTLLSAIGGRYN